MKLSWTGVKTYLSSLQEMPKRGLKASEKLLKSSFNFFSSCLEGKYQKSEDIVNFVDKIVSRINFEFKINLQKRRNSLNFNYHTKVKEVRHDRKRSD